MTGGMAGRGALSVLSLLSRGYAAVCPRLHATAPGATVALS
jgi:hypothetical protein